MPIFEYNCEHHGKFETVLPSFVETHSCPTCGADCEWMPSLVAMQPDDMWHGVMTPYGPLSSRSKFEAIQKEKHHATIGSRSDIDDMKKAAAQAKADIEKKEEAEGLKYWESQFSNNGLLDSDGRVTPEANRKLSDTPITNTKDDDRIPGDAQVI